MKRFYYKSCMAWLLLPLIVAIVGVFTPSAPAAQTLSAEPKHPRVRGVEDMQVVIRHRGDQGHQHTYRHFSPTRLRMEGNTILIEGSVMEWPIGETADIMVSLQTTNLPAPPQRVAAGHWWFDDEDRINSMH